MHGFGVVLEEQFVRNVLEAMVRSVWWETRCVISACGDYAPQVGCEPEEKVREWDDRIQIVPRGESGADNSSDAKLMSRCGIW